MLRFSLAAAALLAASSSASALSRHDTSGLACDRIQAILKSEGTAVLRYRSPRGIVLYDTYTARGGHCSTGGRASPETVPARDTRSCAVYRCNKKRGGGR